MYSWRSAHQTSWNFCPEPYINIALGAVGNSSKDDIICNCKKPLIWDLGSQEHTIKFYHFAGPWLVLRFFLGSCVSTRVIRIVQVGGIYNCIMRVTLASLVKYPVNMSCWLQRLPNFSGHYYSFSIVWDLNFLGPSSTTMAYIPWYFLT